MNRLFPAEARLKEGAQRTRLRPIQVGIVPLPRVGGALSARCPQYRATPGRCQPAAPPAELQSRRIRLVFTPSSARRLSVVQGTSLPIARMDQISEITAPPRLSGANQFLVVAGLAQIAAAFSPAGSVRLLGPISFVHLPTAGAAFVVLGILTARGTRAARLVAMDSRPGLGRAARGRVRAPALSTDRRLCGSVAAACRAPGMGILSDGARRGPRTRVGNAVSVVAEQVSAGR
jgi:hypothetical protein